jgi:hypothetical protein
MSYLPDVLIEIILKYCGKYEIIMFQDKYTKLIKLIEINNINDIHIKNREYILTLNLEVIHKNEDFIHLRNLKVIIKSDFNHYMTDEVFKHFPNLEILNCTDKQLLTDKALFYVPKLKKLYIGGVYSAVAFTDTGLSYVPNLEVLDIGMNNLITTIGIKYLPKLRHLVTGIGQCEITSDIFKYLPKLKTIDISWEYDVYIMKLILKTEYPHIKCIDTNFNSSYRE